MKLYHYHFQLGKWIIENHINSKHLCNYSAVTERVTQSTQPVSNLKTKKRWQLESDLIKLFKFVTLQSTVKAVWSVVGITKR